MPVFTQLDFYLARAAQARADADASTLANVRDRCLRSEEAWSMLADRAARTEQMRSALVVAKAAAAEQMKHE